MDSLERTGADREAEIHWLRVRQSPVEHKSESQIVRRAKRRLVSLGLIECVRERFHGLRPMKMN